MFLRNVFTQSCIAKGKLKGKRLHFRLASSLKNAFAYRKSSINPLRGGLFFQALLRGGGLNCEGGVFNLSKFINESKVSRGRTSGSLSLYCFF